MHGRSAVGVGRRPDHDVALTGALVEAGGKQVAGEDPPDRVVAAVLEQRLDGQRVGRGVAQLGVEREHGAIDAQQVDDERVRHRRAVHRGVPYARAYAELSAWQVGTGCRAITVVPERSWRET